MVFHPSTTTIGREGQLGLIDAALLDIGNRDGASLLFSGEPGIGKSHLLRETIDRARAQSLRVIALRCIQSDVTEPFSLFLRLGASLDMSIPTMPDSDSARFQHGRRLLDEAARIPTVIVIDDLQWCDYLSSILLVQLFDYSTILGLGFIFTTRPIENIDDEERLVNLRSLSRLMNHVPLTGLNRSELSQMIASETGETVQLSDEESLLNLTNGNPFFILELLRTNSTTEIVKNLHMPQEVEEIIDQQIDRLKEDEEIIATAAMIGVRGERRVLSNALSLLGFDDTYVSAVMNHAERLGLLTLGSSDYEFRHALHTHRLINRLSFLRRSELHAAIATSLFHQSRFLAALKHLVGAGAAIDAETGLPLAQIAFELSESTNDYAGISDAGTWLLEFGPKGSAEQIKTLITLSKAQLFLGRRDESRKNAQLAVEMSRAVGDVESEAAAILQWADRSDFTPDRTSIIAAFNNLDIGSLTIDTKIQVLSEFAMSVSMIPTGDEVSVPEATRLLALIGGEPEHERDSKLTSLPAWNWQSDSNLARRLASQALYEAEKDRNLPISNDAHVRALLAWRQSHRAPEFLDQRIDITNRAQSIVNNESLHVDSVRYCHIIDLIESGNFNQADLELSTFLNSYQFGGSFVAQWRGEFVRAGRLISKGQLDEAKKIAQRAFERGQIADEPGRLVVLLEQQATILTESIIPPEISKLFTNRSSILANHYSLITAALANASIGNVAIAEEYVRDCQDIIFDTNREASWLPAVTLFVETAHLLGHYDIASNAIHILEPFNRHHATYIGSVSRGSVRRYLGLAKHAAGDTPSAIDDLLMARNESRRLGEFLWSLACSVDILEILATTDPQRALQLVPEEIIIEAEASEMKWRASRGRAALSRARQEIALRLGLSERQVLVLHGLSTNLTINEIAESLGFSHSTVRQDSMVVYRVLGISGRNKIVDRARELQLL